MRVLTAVVEIPTLAVFHPRQDRALRRSVTLQLIRDDHPWHVLQPLEQLPEKLFRGLLVAAALHQDIQHVVVSVNRAPQVMALAIDGQKDLVEVPLVPWLGASPLQLIRVVLPKLQAPLPDGFMGDVDAAGEQQLLHVAVAQRKTIVEPDPMADDLAG
jgi:hypothetical protein